MRGWRAWPYRLADLFRKDRREQELAAELQSHLQLHIDENVRTGMSVEEARRNALIKLGGVEPAKELYRERRGLPFIETLVQDIRFAFRMLRKNPGFASVAVLTLALGIGANTAIFSVVNAVLLRPLPYKDSARMIIVHAKTAMFPTFEVGCSWPAFEAIRNRADALEQASAYWTEEKTLTGEGEPAVLDITAASGDFFQQLGAQAKVGRLLGEKDQEAGQDRVAVISERLWETRFAGDPGIIGRKLTLDKEIYSIVGVTAKNFRFPERTDVSVPLSLTPDIERDQMFFRLRIIGTLRKGESLARLQGQMGAIAAEFPRVQPGLGKDFKLVARPLLENTVGDARENYLVLLGATAFVLLIACANLTSLLLARGWGRQREMAMRAALGASAGRLQRQCLVESCLLSLFGGAVGMGIAATGVRAFRAMAPAGTPRLEEVSTDWTLLCFALGSSLIAGLLFGLVPSRQASRTAPIEVLKQESAGSIGSLFKIGNLLVVLEVALAFVLLAGSTLMVRTLAHLLRQNPGFRTENVLTFDLPQASGAMAMVHTEDAVIDRQVQQLQEITELVRQVPGVTEVATADHGVLNGMRYMHSGMRLEGVSEQKLSDQHALSRFVSPDYFRILGAPLVRGRAFNERDARGTPKVIIINESMARKFWNALDVLGKHIDINVNGKGTGWIEIVGVAADVRDADIQSEAEPEFFLAMAQWGVQSYHLLVRTEREPDVLAAVISRQIWSRYPDQPLIHVTTLRRTISESIGDQRLHTVLLGTFAGIGVSLALLGIYGVISYAVNRRTREIGVRMALGARPSDVLRVVIGQGLVLIGTGSAIGLAASLAMTRLIAGELYGVKPNDPGALLTAIVVIVLMGSLACWTPARRAMRVDPIVALRYE